MIEASAGDDKRTDYCSKIVDKRLSLTSLCDVQESRDAPDPLLSRTPPGHGTTSLKRLHIARLVGV
jgi:hypothetical protein